jgi:hypothetical protein
MHWNFILVNGEFVNVILGENINQHKFSTMLWFGLNYHTI